MSYINKRELEDNFTRLPNEIVNQRNLSFKAKGILWYLLSKPEDWKTYIKEVANNGKDGVKSIRSGIKELIDAGYVVRTTERDNGVITDWVYYVYDKPVNNVDNPPLSQKVEVGFVEVEKGTLLNTDNILNTNNTNTSYKKSSIETLSSKQLHEHLSEKFGVDIKYVEKECETMLDWLKSKGKRRKDYEAFARNWIRRNVGNTVVVEKPRPIL